MLRNVRTSLTARILLLTCLMLLAASAVTYGIIVLATPYTYTVISTTRLAEQAIVFTKQLERTTLEDCGPIVDWFIRDTGAHVAIIDEDGLVIDIPSNVSITIASAETHSGMETPAQNNFYYYGDDHRTGTVTYTIDSITFPFSFRDDSQVNFLHISPPTEGSNQTLEALGQVAPWLLAIMLLFSALCARFYSRYITRPIVQLSETSQRMAELDFTWQCSETRADEIGVLGRNLNQLSRSLSSALTELKQANAALKRDMDRERDLERQRLAFFSAASHELKTPVTILKGQLTGMLEGIDIYQDRDKYLARSLQVTARMEALVQEILTVSRMEASGFELDRRETDLTELVRQQTALYDELIRQKGLHVVLDLPADATVFADPALIRNALDNVLSNAVFYAPDGASLSAVLLSGDDGTVLTVENSGSHIPEEALPHVFEAFYRADASRDRRTGGSGLGLYLVKTILDRHGAQYSIENTADGVRFTIRFP